MTPDGRHEIDITQRRSAMTIFNYLVVVFSFHSLKSVFSESNNTPSMLYSYFIGIKSSCVLAFAFTPAVRKIGKILVTA